jgi:DNA-binding NarL/FixJ family response regulator
MGAVRLAADSKMHASQPISVVVARFEDLLACGLRGVIQSDASLEIVAQDVEPRRLGVVLRAQRPRVAILDVDALAKLAEVRRLTQQYPDTRLVLLATQPTTAECSQALAFGASAYLGRNTQARDVLTAIHLASRGLQLIPRPTPDPGGLPSPGSHLLTQREAEVLPLLQGGRSNAQIALALQVGVETIRTHARNIYRKLGVSSRRELATLSVRTPLADAGRVTAPPAHRRNAPTRARPRRPGALRN